MRKILLLGGTGLIGSSLKKNLESYHDISAPSREEVNLTDVNELINFIENEKPDLVINAAGKVGGIQANIDYPADLYLNNIQISTNTMLACHKFGIKHLIQFASACVYPVSANFGSLPKDLLMGPMEETSKSYAVAKISALQGFESMRRQFGYEWITFIPSNLYGPGDWSHGVNGHVISMLTQKISDAKSKGLPSITAWGDGSPLRNFLFVDDLASAVNHVISREIWNESVINVSGNRETSILEIANLLKKFIGFSGLIEFDSSKPNGALRKFIDDSFLKNSGWIPRTDLEVGIQKYVAQFTSHFSL